MTNEELDAIERRANAASDGPWTPPTERERGPGCDDRACVVDHEGCAVWPWHRREDMQFAYAARTDVPALIARVRELEAECERMKTFAAQNFSQMIRQEAEQMRAYGLSYEGVRKVLHEYNDGEISFGKLMDLIRAAARAMAEDMQK
jgi:hypothetical protein